MHSRLKANPNSTTIRRPLRPLEQQVMEILWRKNECSVRDVLNRLPEHRAYTTVMTTLGRLFHRGLATRIWGVRKFVYSARVSSLQLDYMLAQRAICSLLDVQENSGAPELVLFFVLQHLSEHDPKLFDEVVEIVKSKKSEHLSRLSELKAANERLAVQ